MFQRIKSFFRQDRKKRELQKALSQRSLSQLAILFETLDKFRKARLIYIDFRPEHMSVTISIHLAQHYLFDENPNVWPKFLSQVELWATFQYNIQQYNKAKTKFMADYHSKAYAENPDMEPEDIMQMKMEASEVFHRQYNENPEIVPLFTYYVLGATEDAKPLLVARRLKDKQGRSVFHTEPVPNDIYRPSFQI